MRWQRGAWVAQWVKHPTQFLLRSWSHSCEIKPHIRLCAGHRAYLRFSLSLSICPSPIHSLSQKRKVKKRKEKRNIINEVTETQRGYLLRVAYLVKEGDSPLVQDYYCTLFYINKMENDIKESSIISLWVKWFLITYQAHTRSFVLSAWIGR